ncbi:DUF350 domain-containing protein [Myxococcota bacterium]|nr:DUF350 domain-containing protein [Myxococcota bacterium]MBU1428984.1 DUF350 domain-containing protein [Myxococcota bacterium]MBU1897640.1 DUF350 domain-containing protein [Myxococcota bacterium]
MINITEIAYTGGCVLVSMALLLLGRWIYGVKAGFNADAQLTEADNPAVGVAVFGYLGGLIIVISSLLSTPSKGATPADLAWDLGEIALYGIIAALLLRFSGWFNDRVILYKFNNRKELIKDRNLGVGAMLFASYIASGLVLAGAFSGQIDPDFLPEGLTREKIIAHELLIGLLFYGLGQVALAIFGIIYRVIQPVDIHDAIERDYEKDGIKYGGNPAAGMAFGGNLVALGVLLWGGAHMDFIGWQENMTHFAVLVGLGFILLPIWRIFVDKIMLGKANLAKEIYHDRNTNAALLESASVIALALVLALTL